MENSISSGTVCRRRGTKDIAGEINTVLCGIRELTALMSFYLRHLKFAVLYCPYCLVIERGNVYLELPLLINFAPFCKSQRLTNL